MEQLIEVNEDGTISFPAELVINVAPHTRYVVERQNGKLVLQPESSATFWEKPTPAERDADFRQWIASIRCPMKLGKGRICTTDDTLPG